MADCPNRVRLPAQPSCTECGFSHLVQDFPNLKQGHSTTSTVPVMKVQAIGVHDPRVSYPWCTPIHHAAPKPIPFPPGFMSQQAGPSMTSSNPPSQAPHVISSLQRSQPQPPPKVNLQDPVVSSSMHKPDASSSEKDSDSTDSSTSSSSKRHPAQHLASISTVNTLRQVSAAAATKMLQRAPPRCRSQRCQGILQHIHNTWLQTRCPQSSQGPTRSYFLYAPKIK